jgi:hypothetical protein
MDRRSFVLAGSFFAMTGCLGGTKTTRSQLDDDSEKISVKTIGDITTFDNAGRIPVSGVGMIVGLQGTGGGTPPGNYREMMKEFLKRKKIDDAEKFLDSPNNALVLVSAEIPAGNRPGFRTDVQISLPPGSKVRSLRGGFLMPCELMSYSTQNTVKDYMHRNDPEYKPQSGGDALLRGSILAEAEGPLQIPLKQLGMNAELEAESLGRLASPERKAEMVATLTAIDSCSDIKTAWIWRGARCFAAQPLFLVLNSGEERWRMANLVADRINQTMHGPGDELKIAKTERKQVVTLRVPPQYRLNMPHFMRMVRMIPQQLPDDNGGYRQLLERQLADPETALSAALRMEALGVTSIPTLKGALKSDYPLVRFAAAESLAYLGEPVAAQELAALAKVHPVLRVYCLTALASLDESASNMALQELFIAEAPELRYGAFRALWEMAPGLPITKGKLHNYCYWIHQTDDSGPPMVHMLSSRRAEVVLFGESARTPEKDPKLKEEQVGDLDLSGFPPAKPAAAIALPPQRCPAFKPGFSFRAGPDIVVTSNFRDSWCIISRFNADGERSERSDLSVQGILKTMGELGATYADVAMLLQQAEKTKTLNCPLVFDALPRIVTVQQLAETGRTDRKLENEEELLKNQKNDPNSTPGLYEQNAAVRLR